MHISNPAIALRKAWERLQECYAAPKITEKALFDRLDESQRVSGKEHTKVRELTDLLMEVQCAKEDGYLPALSYLDKACGIKPIVAKLPFVEFFTGFIDYEVKNRIYPSFTFPSVTS